MRAADFLARDMVEKIMGDMRPDNSSIECIKLVDVHGTKPKFIRKAGERPVDPYILAEVVGDNGFAETPRGCLVLVPENSCTFVPTEGREGMYRRFFVRHKHIRGVTKRSDWWKLISDENRWGS